MLRETKTYLLHVRDGQVEAGFSVGTEKVDAAGVVELRDNQGHELGELGRLMVEVECDGLVHELLIPDLDDNVQELFVLKRNEPLEHHLGGAVILLVLDVAERSFDPKPSPLASLDHLDHVHATDEDLDVVHELRRLVL